jgi:hypothetical protein
MIQLITPRREFAKEHELQFRVEGRGVSRAT